jgi:FkbM family methyltransferase
MGDEGRRFEFVFRENTVDKWVIEEAYERNEYLKDFILPFVPQHGIVVDVGAHIGCFTVLAGEKFKPKLIAAIEPDPSNFDYLLRNILNAGFIGIVKPFRIALWNAAGSRPLYSGGPNTGGNSFFREKLSIEGADINALKGTDVPVTTLDMLVQELGLEQEQIGVLKIDAEGAEAQILEGSVKTLNRTAVVVGELHEALVPREKLERLLRDFVVAFGVPFPPVNLTNFWAVKKELVQSDSGKRFLQQANARGVEDAIWRFKHNIADLEKRLNETSNWATNLDRDLKRRDEECRNLRDQLNQEIKQFQATVQDQQQALDTKAHELVQLQSERDRLTQKIKQFQATIQGQQNALAEKEQELATIKNTIGWKVLNAYRNAREKSKALKLLHLFLTGPIKRVSKEKIHGGYAAMDSISLRKISALATGDAEHFPIQPLRVNEREYTDAVSLGKLIGKAVRPDGHRERYILLRSIYKGLPLSCHYKQQLKSAILRRIPSMRNADAGTVLRLRFPRKDFSRQVACQLPTHGSGSVLLLSHWLPATDRTSGALRTYTILELLREMGYEVVFGADCEKEEHIWFFGSQEEVIRYQCMLEKLGAAVLYGPHEVLRHLYEKGHQYSFTVLSFPEVAYRYLPYVRAYAIHARVVYDPVDLHWLRTAREVGVTNDDLLLQKSANYKRIEQFNTAASDTVIAITHEERTQILKDVQDANVEVIPNIHSCVDTVKSGSGRRNLLFIGHYLHTPNEDAVCYFVKEIFPLIRQQIPGVVFYMVGSHITDMVRSLAARDVVAVGYVPDPSTYFNDCRVFVAPLRYGAGMKGKIGQSMSFGLPVVTTSTGAEGMDLIDGKQVLIADSPDAFGGAVIRLYTDDSLWEQMSTNSLLHIQTHFSKAIVQKKLAQIFVAESRVDRSSVAEVE